MHRTLVLLAVIGALTASDAHAVFCKSKKGRITVRAACKKKESALAGLDFPRNPLAGPRVVDASSTEVGAVIATNSYYSTTSLTVLRSIGEESFSFEVRRRGPVKVDDDKAFGTFLNRTCSGTPYLFVGYGSSVESVQERLADQLVRPLMVSDTGTKGYYVTEDGVTKVDALKNPVSQPYYVSNSVDGAFLDCGVDPKLDTAAACDPKTFCGDFDPVPAKCFCLHCCYQRGSYNSFLAPAKTVDLPVFVAPLHVER